MKTDIKPIKGISLTVRYTEFGKKYKKTKICTSLDSAVNFYLQCMNWQYWHNDQRWNQATEEEYNAHEIREMRHERRVKKVLEKYF